MFNHFKLGCTLLLLASEAFWPPCQAQQASSELANQWRGHQVKSYELLEEIERVRLRVDTQVRDLITGLKEVKIKILWLFSEQVYHVYQLPPS
jgi:hypothetical protein